MKIVLGIWIEESLKDKFKVYCAEKKVSMESIITEAIKERLKNDTLPKNTKRTK